MPSYTEHYGLRKDFGSERYSVSTANGNSDIIDEELNKIDIRIKDLGSSFSFKGSCTYALLPTTATKNDTWFVTDRNCNYTWNGTSWQQSSNVLVIDDADNPQWTRGKAAEASAVNAKINEIKDMIADPYGTGNTYAVGEYCIYEGQLYRCTTAIMVPETWTPAHWELTNIAESMEHSTDDDVNYILGV